MNNRKKARLEAAGWNVGDAKDFLKLSPPEAAYVELKLALGERLRAVRAVQHLSQAEVAKRLHSSQSRVAKMEAADASVSVDLLLKSLFGLGESVKDLFRIVPTKQGLRAKLVDKRKTTRKSRQRDAEHAHA
jgi:transcriptional regulator with XRE-family HTH domain